MNRGSGSILPQKIFEILKAGNAMSCILGIQLCSKKFMLTILVFEIKEKKVRTKSKQKILTIIYHYLLEEG
jgi:hypothetical protein